MPCFKGLAVSIHTPDGAIAEYSIQKQSRFNRITSYIPVPKPTINPATQQPEQSTFAISITLLQPGQPVPYSTPKPTKDVPNPQPQIVGHLPTSMTARRGYVGSIGPYVPMTHSASETVAAYIYFDGRAKEEVATLLRKGEETWVNSRWVSTEGGGLGEREFLFREVGLERWLNGLDLGTDKSKDEVASQLEKRRQKVERRLQKKDTAREPTSDEDVLTPSLNRFRRQKSHVLRYGTPDKPVEKISSDSSSDSSGSDSDEDPMPETTGQIKVALFRVVASGEVKKGEYSAQFSAQDDNSDDGKNDAEAGAADHTTSFGEAKSLDARNIATQTVTGLDMPERPYAVFTFLYRGEKQLQKMGILKPKKTSLPDMTGSSPPNLNTGFEKELSKPLRSGFAKDFTGMRDPLAKKKLDKDKEKALEKEKEKGKKRSSDDSDDEYDNAKRRTQTSSHDGNENTGLNRANESIGVRDEDREEHREIAKGIKQMRLKRQHSADSLTALPSTSQDVPSTLDPLPTQTQTPTLTSPSPTFLSAPLLPSTVYTPESSAPQSTLSPLSPTSTSTSTPSIAVPSPHMHTHVRQQSIAPDASMFGSPLKKARSSIAGDDYVNHFDGSGVKSAGESLAQGLGMGLGGFGFGGFGFSGAQVDEKAKGVSAEKEKEGGVLAPEIKSEEVNDSENMTTIADANTDSNAHIHADAGQAQGQGRGLGMVFGAENAK